MNVSAMRPPPSDEVSSTRWGWLRAGVFEAFETSQQLAAALRYVARPLIRVCGSEAPLAAWRDPIDLVGERFTGERSAGLVPAHRLELLGDVEFCRDYGLRYPLVAGAMANGLSSVELVEAMGRARMLGVFGAAGLAPDAIAEAIERISTRLGDRPWAFNLIHSPQEPALERRVAELYIERGVRLVSASAFLGLTLPLVRYRTAGIHLDPSGRIVAPNRVIGKVSRVEVAKQFLSPPPAAFLAELVQRGALSETQAALASRIPIAQELTVEADSGGHTDNASALALLPTLLALRDQIARAQRYDVPLRIGAAGGIATPHAAAAAFAMGAAYVVTGSVNQACRESGTSDAVRQMLAAAQQGDVTMAPAADMFEAGVKLQVLKRGTLFAPRAQRLYEHYTRFEGLAQLPPAERTALEQTIFRAPIEQVWRETEQFWRARDPEQLERARDDAKHQMALLFRWYLGQSSRWAIHGEASRVADYQIWCGPAMAAFNEWAKGSFLERWEARRVVPIALNILHGAAVLGRARCLSQQGVALPPAALDVCPREPAQLEEYLS